MIYNTTRNSKTQKYFHEIVCLSNAMCGGLYIPQELPRLTREEFEGMSYSEIAEKVIGIFTEIPKEDIGGIVRKSLQNFTAKEIFETRTLNDDLKTVELFHGPTLSFKDYPMQFLGNIIEYILKEKSEKLNIVTATSGDTGSAAIYAFAAKENVKIVVLHPKGRVTEFQRKQMTTCNAENVLNIAVDGTFDDCQRIVKEITNSKDAQKSNISTVNSINWGRIMMQIVYYIKILLSEKEPVNIFVPTGNFGNIFACYFLQKCGFSGTRKMYISNNANDVIANAYKTGIMKNSKTVHTLSPAIDISVPSNFERMIYLETGCDAAAVAEIYAQLQKGQAQFDEKLWSNFIKYFEALSVNNKDTLNAIREVHDKYGYVIDPHTAVAFAHYSTIKPEGRSVIISTAHPCKFENAVQKAINKNIEIPSNNKDVISKSEKLLETSIAEVPVIIEEFWG